MGLASVLIITEMSALDEDDDLLLPAAVKSLITAKNVAVGKNAGYKNRCRALSYSVTKQRQRLIDY